jgi:hypothetical protein
MNMPEESKGAANKPRAAAPSASFGWLDIKFRLLIRNKLWLVSPV